MTEQKFISIRGAREHNLKNINITAYRYYLTPKGKNCFIKLKNLHCFELYIKNNFTPFKLSI